LNNYTISVLTYRHGLTSLNSCNTKWTAIVFILLHWQLMTWWISMLHCHLA